MDKFYKFTVDNAIFNFKDIESAYLKLMEYYIPTPEGKLPLNDTIHIHKSGGIILSSKEQLENLMERCESLTISIASKGKKYFNIKTIKFD